MIRNGVTGFHWVEHGNLDDVASGSFAYGGPCKKFIAATALKAGDLVYLTTGGKVTKSNTAADYQAGIGVVVGGESVLGIADDTWTVAGRPTVASGDGKWVLVALTGAIVPVESDGAITIGGKLGQGATTAGRPDDGATAGQRLGIALAAAGGAGVKIPMLVMPH